MVISSWFLVAAWCRGEGGIGATTVPLRVPNTCKIDAGFRMCKFTFKALPINGFPANKTGDKRCLSDSRQVVRAARRIFNRKRNGSLLITECTTNLAQGNFDHKDTKAQEDDSREDTKNSKEDDSMT